MALSTSDHGPRVADLYADLTIQWARQTTTYLRSLRLYHECLRRRAEQQPDLPPRRRPVRIEVVEIPNDGDLGASRDPGVRPLPAGAQHRGATARSPLTARQREIAVLIAQGLTNGQIAERIVVSRGTVGNHIGHMLRRLGVKNRAQIAAWAIRHAGAEPSLDGGATRG
jgi:DNA-binding CsgD family transcriptional regulator